MIVQHALAILWLALVGLTYTRLLRDHADTEAPYRSLIFVSGACLALAALIFWLSAFSAYPTWFVPEVYSVLDWIRNSLVIIGGALVLWALIKRMESADSAAPPKTPAIGEQSRRKTGASAIIESDISRSGLASLNVLRVALSQPYPFVELARLALSGIAETGGMTGGAIYVYNESTQEMTVAATVGLTPEQERVCERISLRTPILVETFDGGEPLLSTDFASDVFGSQLSAERYPGSCALLIPVLRNDKPLGLVTLFADKAPRLTNSQLSTLSQMSDIVADKFVNVRLKGELARTKRKAAERENSRKRMTQAFRRAFDVLSNSADLDAVCQELVGLGGADAVALIEADSSDTGLRFCATSGAFPETTSGFERAARQALERQTLVLLSREQRMSQPTELSEGEREPMALVAPVSADVVTRENPGRTRSGILFWNNSGRFFLTAEELQDFQDWLRPLTVSLQEALKHRKSRGASGMLEIVQGLLRPEQEPMTEKARLKRFVSSVRRELELSDACLLLQRTDNGQLRPLISFGVDFEAVEALVVLPGEGALGRCAALGSSAIEEGAERLAEAVGEYDMLNRDVFGGRFSRLGDIEAQVIVPIVVNGSTRYVISFFFSRAREVQESARALLPLCQLLALVLSVRELQSDFGSELLRSASFAEPGETAAAVVNAVNNDLSTIIGNCQLVAGDPNLSGAVERVLRLVIERAERSAQKLRAQAQPPPPADKKLSESATVSEALVAATTETVSLAEELRAFASERVVGGQILLTEGKAREVEFELESDFPLNIPSVEAKRLVEQLCHGLSAQAGEREIVTVSVYRDGPCEYLDISRRWRNLPPTRRIGSYARFGAPPDSGFFDVPLETLNALKEQGVEVALDRRSRRPAYLTLRIPGSKPFPDSPSQAEPGTPAPRILAIDDQTMILDLLSAMCDSLGYQIDSFESPIRAMAAFERGAHEIVISDVAMPQMNGWEVARTIRKLRPETYLIFITGWEEGLSSERLKSHAVNQVLKKPFRLEQLTAALQEAQRLSRSATPI